MKQKLIIFLALAVAILVLVFAKQDYHASQQQKASVRAQLATARDEVAAAKKTVDESVDKYNALWEQCQIGYAAYQQLPAPQKAKATAPNCGLSIVQ
jgi:hypothetical protein